MRYDGYMTLRRDFITRATLC